MQKKSFKRENKYTKQNHWRGIWHKLAQVAACVTAFCITYSLILPAITLGKIQGDLGEQSHFELSYEKEESEASSFPNTNYEQLGVHIHNLSCYDDDNNLICNGVDYLVPEQEDNSKVDNETSKQPADNETLTEPADKEISKEPLGDETSTEGSAQAPHVHEDKCYSLTRGELLCGLHETEGHAHEGGCFTQGELFCALPETEDHAHGTACYESVLTCTLEEKEAHQHTDACYETKKVLICQQEGDTSTDTNTEKQEPTEQKPVDKEPAGIVYYCDLEEHSHVAACRNENDELVCGLEEHTHFILCTDPEAEAYCWLTDHTHVAACYDCIGSLVVMIDTLPTFKEAEEILKAYEEKGDKEGYVAYQQKVADFALQLYYAYRDLTEDEKQRVTNYDRLMALSSLWAELPYDAPPPRVAIITRVQIIRITKQIIRITKQIIRITKQIALKHS